MANSENTDLMSLGQHCAVAHCGQLDFLPFRCDCCEQIFCLEHRTYAAHQCPKAQTKETEVIICPLCASAIKFKSGEDANSAFEHHQRTGCDPQNYDRVHKKRKCPVANCKEKLTTVNTYQCKDCGTEICLKHRLPDDHNCQERKRKILFPVLSSENGPFRRGSSKFKDSRYVSFNVKSFECVSINFKAETCPSKGFCRY